jgi:hypothetical protein
MIPKPASNPCRLGEGVLQSPILLLFSSSSPPFFLLPLLLGHGSRRQWLLWAARGFWCRGCFYGGWEKVRRRNARARWSRCGERKLAGGAEEPTGGESGARARAGRAGAVVALAVAIEEMKMGP